MNIKTGTTAYKSFEKAKEASVKIQNAFENMDKTVFLPKVQVFDWNNMTDDQMADAVKLAYHCCVNGPVGVTTLADFPGFDYPLKIKDLLGCSSAQWKGFCYEFKRHIPKDLLKGSKSFEIYQGFWPTEVEMNEKVKTVLKNKKLKDSYLEQKSSLSFDPKFIPQYYSHLTDPNFPKITTERSPFFNPVETTTTTTSLPTENVPTTSTQVEITKNVKKTKP